jgi:hypothetical protein
MHALFKSHGDGDVGAEKAIPAQAWNTTPMECKSSDPGQPRSKPHETRSTAVALLFIDELAKRYGKSNLDSSSTVIATVLKAEERTGQPPDFPTHPIRYNATAAFMLVAYAHLRFDMLSITLLASPP